MDTLMFLAYGGVICGAFYLGYSLALSSVKFTLENSSRTLEQAVKVTAGDDPEDYEQYIDEDAYIAMGNTHFYSDRNLYPKEGEE